MLLHGDGQYAARAAARDRRAARARRVRRGVRLADDGQGRGAQGRDAALQVRRQPDPHHVREHGRRHSTSREWHSGYRAYSVAALKDIPFEQQLRRLRRSTPRSSCSCTRPERRSSRSRSPRTTATRSVTSNGIELRPRRRARRAPLPRATRSASAPARWRSPRTTTTSSSTADETSHGRIVQWLERKPPSRVLDLGCADGRLGELLRACGHEVIGVDVAKADGVGERARPLLRSRPRPRHPRRGRRRLRRDPRRRRARARPRARRRCCERRRERARSRTAIVIASVPNFGHWYPRPRVALGRFDYDRRGILDVGHVRFFTRQSFEHIVDDARASRPGAGRRSALPARGVVSAARRTQRPEPRRVWARSNASPSTCGRRCSDSSSSTSSNRPARTSDATERRRRIPRGPRA